MSRVVALSGFIGSGKDTVSQILVQDYGFIQYAFADALKDVCVAIFGWDRALLDGKLSESRAWREQVDEWWAERLGIPNLTPRWAMQNVGSILRTNLCEDIWIATVERKMLEKAGDRPILISDARYFNELDTARRLGAKIIRVRRGDEPVWYGSAVRANTHSDPAVRSAEADLLRGLVHESEWCWIGYDFDALIENDGTLDDLYAKVRGLIDE